MLRPLFVFAPVIVAGALAWPMTASKVDASGTPSTEWTDPNLRLVLDEALRRVVPGAHSNELTVTAVDLRPLGIGDWHHVTGAARVGEGASAATYRFSARVDAERGSVQGLRVRAAMSPTIALADEGRTVIEAAIGRRLAEEFPDQSPRFTLVSASRVADAGGGERVFQGRGLIDFGNEGEVLAPIEVRFDANARITSLRYSLDELDPTPFDDAAPEHATGFDAMVATR